MAAPTESTEISVPWGSRTIQVVLASTLLTPLSVALISPTLPVFRNAFDLTDPQASLVVSAILAPGIVLSPFVGLLTDRVGRRRVLIASLTLWSLAGASVALGPPYAVVIALRLVQGTALAGTAITTVTLIGDTVGGVRRNAVLGVNVAVLSVGAAVYPVVGGSLAGVAWNLPFWLYLAGLPVALFATLVLEEPAVGHESRNLAYLRHMLLALSWEEAALLYGSAFVIDLLLFGAVFTALPFLLAGAFDLGPALIGLVVTAEAVGSAAAATQNGRLARYVSDTALIATGFVILGIGLFGTWLAPSPALIGVATLLVGVGWGLTIPSIDDGISELVPSEYRGGSLSLRNSTTFLGRAGGPLLFAAVGARTGYRPLLLAAGIGAVAFGGLVVLLRR